jgi:hypothetical protein
MEAHRAPPVVGVIVGCVGAAPRGAAVEGVLVLSRRVAAESAAGRAVESVGCPTLAPDGPACEPACT